jgi:hypothetical protein
LAFLDEEDDFAPDEPGPTRPSGGGRQRQFVVRRLIALAAGVLILILLLLAFRACQNARKERGFENYVSDLTTIASTSNQLSEEFFGRLEDPGKLTELTFRAEVSADRGTAADLLNRVESLDTPDELAAAQEELVFAFKLRSDGISGIADQIGTALGDQGRDEATDKIAAFMRYFLASDVLYQRARQAIEAEIEEEEITTEKIPESVFLPEPPEPWLDETELRTTLAGAAGGAKIAPGVHGLGLLQTVVTPGDVALTDGGTFTVSGDGPFELVAQVQNQGESQESDVTVHFELTGGAEDIEGEATIRRIAAGETADATMSIEPDPETETALTLEVTADPVPGEEVADNNTQTYTVTFGG